LNSLPATVRFEQPSSLSGSVRVPGSKSYTHRGYLTAVTQQGGRIHHPLRSEDTEATRRVLDGFDAEVTDQGDTVEIRTDSAPSIETDTFYAGESGTLFRFLIPICSLLSGPDEVVIRGEGSLNERTHHEVIESMRANGLRVEYVDEEGKAPVRCFPGQSLSDDVMELEATTTSQHVSGSLIALGATGGGDLRLTTELVSAPYVSMTRDVLEEAGIRVARPEEELFRVATGQPVPLDYTVPGDYSSAAFLLAGAVLTEGELRVEGLFENDPQADRRILSVLSSMGADVEWKSEDELTVSALDGFEGFTVDASDCPDLVPILTVLGSFADGPVTIENIAHLANKESDRINIPCRELEKLGVSATPYEDRIEIEPDSDGYEGGTVHAHNDHRLAMAFSIFGAVNGGVTVTGAECVAKSYPHFYQHLRQLGASFEQFQQG
jgi:3-phosphoshikimate 1-carboxyvinyltransferase